MTTLTQPTVEDDRSGRGEAQPVLMLMGSRGSTVYPLPERGSVIIGRSRSCDVCIEDESVSRRHARLTIGTRCTIEDLGSANGTEVFGRRVSEGRRARLEMDQIFRLGTVTAVVQERVSSPVSEADGPLIADEAMKLLYAEARQIARGTISVLLLGESGVGKDVLARAIHRASPRASGPFLCLNCAGMSATLLESELFGHMRGAFTDAIDDKPGLLEVARGGTVFLDEIGEMAQPVQARLLRALEDSKLMRVGGTEPIEIDVRFIAATNQNIERAVVTGAFRRDLFYRVGGAMIEVPPLRERTAEIEPMARMFLRRAAAEVGRRAPELSGAAVRAMLAHDWPGNLRELRNVSERALLLCDGELIRPQQLGLGSGVPESEPERIRRALEECAGNQTAAARRLGMSRRTLINRLDEYGMPRPRKNKKQRAS